LSQNKHHVIPAQAGIYGEAASFALGEAASFAYMNDYLYRFRIKSGMTVWIPSPSKGGQAGPG
jgi:hypothetical protein